MTQDDLRDILRGDSGSLQSLDDDQGTQLMGTDGRQATIEGTCEWEWEQIK